MRFLFYEAEAGFFLPRGFIIDRLRLYNQSAMRPKWINSKINNEKAISEKATI